MNKNECARTKKNLKQHEGKEKKKLNKNIVYKKLTHFLITFVVAFFLLLETKGSKAGEGI